MINSLKSPSRWLLYIFVILLGAAAWIWFSRVPSATAETARVPAPRESFPAPDFTLFNFEGEAKTLAAYRGQVVIINFWASWCGPCRAEMPALKKVYEANKARGLEVLAVNSTVQDNEKEARLFAWQYDLSFPVLLDTDGTVSRRYLLRAMPSTFFIDKRGVIRSVIIGGPMSEATLQTQVENLLLDN